MEIALRIASLVGAIALAKNLPAIILAGAHFIASGMAAGLHH